jgi:hypothetical protein
MRLATIVGCLVFMAMAISPDEATAQVRTIKKNKRSGATGFGTVLVRQRFPGHKASVGFHLYDARVGQPRRSGDTVLFRQRLPGGRGIIGGYLHHVESVTPASAKPRTRSARASCRTRRPPARPGRGRRP